MKQSSVQMQNNPCDIQYQPQKATVVNVLALNSINPQHYNSLKLRPNGAVQKKLLSLLLDVTQNK